MRNTSNWGLTVPSDDTDPDDVPAHLGGVADQLDSLLGSQFGLLSARPATGKPGQLYFVDSGEGVGRLYQWSGNTNAWALINGFRAENAGAATPTAVSWASEGATGTATTYARADHNHPAPPNPVTAHVAAADPHPQYALKTDVSKFVSGYATSFMLGGM